MQKIEKGPISSCQIIDMAQLVVDEEQDSSTEMQTGHAPLVHESTINYEGSSSRPQIFKDIDSGKQSSWMKESVPSWVRKVNADQAHVEVFKEAKWECLNLQQTDSMELIYFSVDYFSGHDKSVIAKMPEIELVDNKTRSIHRHVQFD